MRKVLLVIALVATCPAGDVFAQTDVVPVGGIAWPGSFWIMAAEPGAAEPGNIITQSAFEQGVTIWQRGGWFVVPFLAAGMTTDVNGYSWNNGHPVTSGLKLVRRVPGGALEVWAGVKFEVTPETGHPRHAAGAVSYWAGWTAQTQSLRRFGTGFPGHVYAVSGALTGRDPDNWITTVGVQQGVTLHRLLTVGVVPYVGVSMTADSKKRPWENRALYDGGLKLVRHLPGGVVEAGFVQRRYQQWRVGAVATSPVAYVNFWIGWNPRTLVRH
jgi:hypothetical protein